MLWKCCTHMLANLEDSAVATGLEKVSFHSKIMVTFFKRSHALTAAVSAPDPVAGHHWPTPLPKTPGHSRATLGQSLVGSLLLSPGSWSTQNSVCFLQESISQSCVSSGGWVNGDLLQESLYHTQVCCTRAPAPGSATADPYLCRRHSNTVLAQSLWTPWILVCTRFVWALWALLASKGFDSKCDFVS